MHTQAAGPRVGDQIPLLRAEQRWECPSCTFTDVTHVPGHISHLHRCPGQRLLWVAMVPAGTRAVHVVQRPEDYIGDSLVQRDAEGQPVSAVNVVRDHGQDAVAYPVTATASAEQVAYAKEIARG
jgi:hypothetical protein